MSNNLNYVGFYLSMPNNNSWDGKWSGEGRLYAKRRKLTKTLKDKIEQLLDGQDSQGFYFGWSDGWGANVEVKLINGKEARKISTKSKGFCGYDWMIDSILKHGKIIIE